jgi:PPOX class probable F420-dependent enzyme
MTAEPGPTIGAHALVRLRDERIAWLTVVRPDGQPVSMPIWFLWADGELLVYSDKAARRNAHVEANPRVAFHLDTNAGGGDIVTILGEARIDPTVPPVTDNAAYRAKYGDWIDEYLGGIEAMAAVYDVPIRIRPTRVIAPEE